MHLSLFSLRQKNLSLQRPYRIGAQWPDESFGKTERTQYPDHGQLTQGQTAGPQVKDPNWVGLLRQYGRSVTVDLGDICHVEHVSLRFLQHSGAGIQVPSCVRYYLSDDGAQWRLIADVRDQPAWYEQTQATVRSYDCSCDQEGRYLRAQFTAKVYAFVSGFEVLGHARQGSRQSPGDDTELSIMMGDDYLVDPSASDLALPQSSMPSLRSSPAMELPTYLRPSDERSGGLSHIQLIYTGSGSPGDTWRVHDFLPTVAALDDEQRPLAPLFDGALFLPFGKMQTSAAAWSAWLDDLFAPNVQLQALDAAVGMLKEATGALHLQAGVILTLPGTNANPSHFGAISPGGLNLDMNPATAGFQGAAQNKLAALSWMQEEMMRRWQAQNLPHLRLTGFYWHPETISLSDPFDPWLIAQTAQAVHQQGLRLYWIPMYGAVGIPMAHELGMDAVIVQPNAAFHPEVDVVQRLRATSELAKHYRMGVEIELHWDITHDSDASRRAHALHLYEAYLAAARDHEFAGDCATKAYYLNAKSLVACYHSAHPESQQAYAATRAFILGQ